MLATHRVMLPLRDVEQATLMVSTCTQKFCTNDRDHKGHHDCKARTAASESGEKQVSTVLLCNTCREMQGSIDVYMVCR